MISRWTGLLAITLAGFLVRVVNIDQWPLWSDEALTLIVAQWPIGTLFAAPVDPTPGFYYALHKLLLGPTVGVAAARSLSVVAGTLLIPAVYLLARQARIPALLSAALTALAFPLIDYSQEARAYSLLVLLVIASAGSFVWWGRTGRMPALVGALAFGLLAFYTHFAALFWVAPLVLAALWTGKRRAVAPLLGMAILAVPEAARLARYPQSGFSWLLQADLGQAADTLSRALLPFRPPALAALVVAAVLAWRAWVHRAALRNWASANRPAAAVLLILLAVPLEVWLFGFVVKPIFMTRTILIAVPGFVLALALLLSFEQRFVRFAVVGLYAAGLIATGTMRPREDWRGIARRVGSDSVLVCQVWQAPAMEHALPGSAGVFIRYGDGVLAIHGEPWPVAYFRALTDDQAKRRALEAGRRLDAGLHPVWAVRAGSLESLGRAPTTLAEAARVCDANGADNAPGYRAD
jgi:uncharacterized membrane protein